MFIRELSVVYKWLRMGRWVKHLESKEEELMAKYGKVYSEKPNSASSSSLVFSPKAGFGRNQSPVRRPVWLWHTALEAVS